MNKIYILTGPIHSGKTTAITNWLSTRNDAAGIISPVVKGKRILIDIISKEIRPLEVNSEEDSPELIEIGKYRFDQTAFNWGNERIISSLASSPNWLVIDEFGHLELKQQGFFPSVFFLMNKMKDNLAPKSIIIVRDYLVEKFIREYKLSESQLTIITKEVLTDLN